MFTRWAIIWTCCFYCIYNSYAVTDICSMGWKIVTIISQKCSKALTLVIILETQTIDIFRIFSFMMLISLDLLNTTYYFSYIEILLNVICIFTNVTAILYWMHIWISKTKLFKIRMCNTIKYLPDDKLFYLQAYFP